MLRKVNAFLRASGWQIVAAHEPRCREFEAVYPVRVSCENTQQE